MAKSLPVISLRSIFFKPQLRFLLLLLLPTVVWGQLERDASQIRHEISGLKNLGTVLYMAAHPDDENTRLISYLARERNFRTAYLALTRGDGGQNLLGSEKGDALGLLRTQELLSARKIDGGEQYFSRAIDFGYSKNPAETFSIWERKEVLKDAVWVIRKTRPDLIITRFPPDERAGHGHHTASAILAVEAMKEAANPNFKFNDARDGKLLPWKAKRCVWNTSWWFYRRQDAEFDDSKLLKIDVGVYSPLLGKSLNSIASMARSQHKSQGFGTTISRGSEVEYFEHLYGDSAKKDLFEGIDFSWYRFGNYNLAKRAEAILDKILRDFDPERPENSIDDLFELKSLLADLPDEQWKEYLDNKISSIIASSAGLWCEVLTDSYYACEDDSISFTLNAIKRNKIEVKTRFVDFGEFTYHIEEPTELDANKLTEVVSEKVRIKPKHYGYSNPYWLKEEAKKGLFTVENPEMIGYPEKRPFQEATVLFEIGGEIISVSVPIEFKERDRVKGEVRRPFEVRPKVSVNFEQGVRVLLDKNPVEIPLTLLMNTANFRGGVRLECPKGWTIEPAELDVTSGFKGERLPLSFTLTAGSRAESGAITAVVEEESNRYTQSLVEIDYDHIPAQVMMPQAKCQLVYLESPKRTKKVGYLPGAGDEIPEALRNLGYDPLIFDPEAISSGSFDGLDVVIVGIRAYNVLPNSRNIQKLLEQFMDAGGKVIVQYTTSYGIKADAIGPNGLMSSRKRITDETAPLKVLNPSHPLFNTPNNITEADFDGWVQERGLYFIEDLPEGYVPLLEGNDEGENPLNGMLVEYKMGKGTFIYTGLSFFRELPAGVEGAYRLFVNLIEY